MGERLSVVTPLHVRTCRDYVGRMTDNKVEAMRVARRYGEEYWDGDRRYGYGGYRYDGRWKAVAEAFVARYGLHDGSSILDVGCGKGFLLHEFRQLLPHVTIAGLDVSAYAIAHAPEDVRPFVFAGDAAAPLPYADGAFEVVLSLGCLHNLPLDALRASLREIVRVGRRQYVMVESFRNEQELFNLQCWALTCESFFRPSTWESIFRECEYAGDYEFIYFE